MPILGLGLGYNLTHLKGAPADPPFRSRLAGSLWTYLGFSYGVPKQVKILPWSCPSRSPNPFSPPFALSGQKIINTDLRSQVLSLPLLGKGKGPVGKPTQWSRMYATSIEEITN